MVLDFVLGNSGLPAAIAKAGRVDRRDVWDRKMPVCQRCGVFPQLVTTSRSLVNRGIKNQDSLYFYRCNGVSPHSRKFAHS